MLIVDQGRLSTPSGSTGPRKHTLQQLSESRGPTSSNGASRLASPGLDSYG
jgi:hypothetical protein